MFATLDHLREIIRSIERGVQPHVTLTGSLRNALLRYFDNNLLLSRVILILTFFRNHYFACSQVLPLGSMVSKLFLFLLYDLSFPCRYFFFGFNGNFNGTMGK